MTELILCRGDGKILFSASIDSTIIQWSSSFEPFSTIEVIVARQFEISAIIFFYK